MDVPGMPQRDRSQQVISQRLVADAGRGEFENSFAIIAWLRQQVRCCDPQTVTTWAMALSTVFAVERRTVLEHFGGIRIGT